MMGWRVAILSGGAALALTLLHAVPERPAEELLTIDGGAVKVGIDRARGASITYLSSSGYPKNMVNRYDPGRLIQQSYYAGRRLDRRKEGQHEAWSPWSWNPIQGGGVGSWARVTEFRKKGEVELFGETVPKLWDMADEEAAAVMRQWTGFEEGIPGVVVVRCELVSKRELDDRWGTTARSPQEVPACYFTRNFDAFRSYMGDGKWVDEKVKVGPPWMTAGAARRAMACFNTDGQGVAVFSPGAASWNFGPHAGAGTDDPDGGPCVHIAPVAMLKLPARGTLKYRYWLVTGSAGEIGERLDRLWERYSGERPVVTEG